MVKDTWRCSNDEHINKINDVECEICNKKRPQIKLFEYECTSEFKKIKISWEVLDADKVIIVTKEQSQELVGNEGFCYIENIENKESIQLIAENNISSIYDNIKIKLFKPEIVFFQADNNCVLENSNFSIRWLVHNATSITIKKIGVVDSFGEIIVNEKNRPFKLSAINEIGKIEAVLEIDVLPRPKIKEFTTEKVRLEYGKTTNLIWYIEHASDVKLMIENEEIKVDLKSTLAITPLVHTTYKLLVTALDGMTVYEKETKIEVYKKVVLNYFKADILYVIESLPIHFTWNIENANEIIFEDNLGNKQVVTNLNEFTVKSSLNIRCYTIIATDPLGNRVRKMIDVEVEARPRVNIQLPQLNLPKLTLNLGNNVIENTSFDYVFNQIMKKPTPRKGLGYLIEKLIGRK